MDAEDFTGYLKRVKEGDSEAIGDLLPLIYDDLRDLAGQVFAGQWRNHTLQPTAIVHEAYLRMVKPENPGWESKRHFLRVAALAMRQLLLDYARGRNAEKREGGLERVAITQLGEGFGDDAGGGQEELDLVCLDEALTKLAQRDERQARIVELRFLTGLTVQETAEVLELSERTVYLDWKMARAWLQRQLRPPE